MSVRRLAALLCLLPVLEAGAVDCTLDVRPLNFGAMVATSRADADTVGVVEVRCVGIPGEQVSYRIELQDGSRQLAGSRHGLPYGLYVDAARTTLWGDGSDGTGTVGDRYVLAAASETRQYPVFARVYADTRSAPGQYTDAVIAVLSY